MSRILLLLDHRENRRLLEDVLVSQHEVIIPETDEALDDEYDLCLIDGPALERLGQRVEARKCAEAPVFLPFLLITTRQDVGLATRHLWHSMDELIITPIERIELQARVEILLRARNASLQVNIERTAFATQTREVTTILESIDTAVMITDREGRILRANTALARMVRRPLSSLSGKTFADLTGLTLDVPWRQRAWEGRKTTKRHGVPLRFSFAPERGTTYWDVVVQPILQPDGQVGSVLEAYTEVSEYVIARQAVEEERAGLRTILETLPVGVFIVDTAGGIVSANAASRRIWGGPIPDVRNVDGYRVFNGWRVDNGQPVGPGEWAAAKALTQGSTTLDDEIDIQRFDGTSGAILNSATPLRDETGQITGAIWVLQDITVRRHSEQERERLLAEMDATLASIADGLVIYTPDGTVLRANAVARQFLGSRVIEPGHPQPEQATAVVETQDGVVLAIDEFPAMRALRGETVTGQVLAIRYPEHTVWVSATTSPIRTPEGEVLGAVLNFADITELKEAEDALRRSEERYRTLFQENSAAMLIIDPDTGQIVDANLAAQTYYGYPFAVLCRMKIQQINTLTPDEVRAEMARARAEKRRHFLFRHRLANGDIRDVEVYSGPVTMTDNTYLYSIIFDITDRRQAEAQLRLLSAALESAANSVVITDSDGVITWVNPAFSRMTGYARDEVLGQNPHILNSGKHPHTYYEAMWATIRSGKVWHGQLINRRKNGTLYTEEMTITPVLTDHDTITHFVAIKEDITTRKQVEEERERLLTEVQRSAAELDAIFMAIVDPVVAYDAAGKVIHANPAMVMTLGRDPFGLTCEELSDALAMRYPDGRFIRCAEAPAIRALQGEHVVSERLLITDIDGHEMVIEVSATPLELDGQRWGVVSIWHDITRRERAYEEAKRRTSELDATLAGIADGLIIYNPEGEIVRMNDMARELLGFTEEESRESVIQRWAHRHVTTPDGQPFPLEQLPTYRALHGERVQGVVLVVSSPPAGRPVWISASAGPILTADHRLLGAVANYADITPLHELQEQQKVLIHLVSHDLRAPLTIVKGHIQLLEESLAQAGVNGPIMQGLKAVDRGIERMNAMIQDLVDAARAEGRQLELTREAVDLRSYLPELLQRSTTAMETARIHLELPDDLPPVSADYNRLERIFTNLLSNALKYSDPGTPVRVRARRTDGEVEVAVIDQGHGIAPDDLPHLFDRFYRTKSTKAEGIGLGLYITKQQVEAHGLPAKAGTATVGGRIWVESEIGKGSTFYFTLPAA